MQTTAHHVAWIGLGSNLEAPAQQVRSALDELAAADGLRLLAASALYQTTPVGPQDQPDFCNACAAFATAHRALDVLATLQAIEQRHGRVRDLRWGPRTLDLDLLAFDDQVVAHPRLDLPHPRAHERGFVLVPLAEIAPALTLPGFGRVAELRAAVGDAGVRPWPAA